MAAHSSVLAWRIPWTEAPGGYSPWGCKELDTAERLNDKQERSKGYLCPATSSHPPPAHSEHPTGNNSPQVLHML